MRTLGIIGAVVAGGLLLGLLTGFVVIESDEEERALTLASSSGGGDCGCGCGG